MLDLDATDDPIHVHLQEVLGTKIDRSFESSDRIHGARRVWHDVPDEGLFCGPDRVERLA